MSTPKEGLKNLLPRQLRQPLGRARRRLFPSAPMAAWRKACKLAEQTERYSAGTIELMGLTLHYPDLVTLCPQWKSIFVEERLRFETGQSAPHILDCGANVGLASLYFHRLHPGAAITAFEADPQIHALLRANLEANGAGSVEAVQAAIWTDDGEVDFRREGSDSGAVAAVASATRAEAAPVPAVRLRRLLAEGPPVDLLKLDVEGAELALLEDCESELGRVDALVIDLHEFDPGKRIGPRLLALLERSGFVYSQSELVPLSAPARGPFAPACDRWASLIHAWRPGERSR